MAKAYDLVILGCGPAGERAAILAAKAGRQVAVVERANVVGGTRINWGTIPSKTLRESALFVWAHTHHRLEGIRTEIADEITVSDFMYREHMVVQRELELINRTLGRYNIEVFRGHGRFLDRRRVAVLDDDGVTLHELEGDVFVIATGTSPNHPEDVTFDGTVVFDSDTILKLPRIPRTMIVLGAGVIGVEYASIFAALGVAVTLVDTRNELLPYLDREIAARLEQELGRLGITIRHGERHRRIARVDGEVPSVRCETSTGEALQADALLYAVGRDGNTVGIGLEAVGIEPTERGLIEVNQVYQTVQPHIYAAGDVIGYPALASTSMEQGRQAVRHAFGIPGPLGREATLPFAIYAIPEVGTIGATEEDLERAGTEYVIGRGLYRLNPRGQIMGDTGGMLKLLFDLAGLRLLGAHIIGSQASELVHIGQAYLRADATALDIAEALYNYPTLADLYRHAALEALREKMQRRPGWQPWTTPRSPG
jgi:NAD(P) transhydrogenase